MRLRFVGATLLVGVALAACGGSGPDTVDAEDYDSGPGVVQKKDIDSAHTTCYSRNKKGACTSSSTDDKDWLILVKPNDEDRATVWVDVDEETYDRYQKGSVYP